MHWNETATSRDFLAALAKEFRLIAGCLRLGYNTRIIENDLLEAIIQLPNNIFYNTGITTYIWLLSNKKAKGRDGKVQLIDASQLFEKLRKNLGAKNCAFTGANLKKLLDPKLWLARRELLEIAEKLHQQLGTKTWNDFTLFTEDVKTAIKKLKLKPGAPQLKTILDAVSWRDPEAEPIVADKLYLEAETEGLLEQILSFSA